MPARRPTRPVIALSLGDPGGIGPEVVVKALANPELRQIAHFRVYGVESALAEAAEKAGIDPYWWGVEADERLIASALDQDVVLVRQSDTSGFSRVHSKVSGELSFQFVESAIRDTQRPAHDPLAASGIVTAPISKKAWSLAGRGKYPGHTELLARRLGARRSAMMFVSPRFKVVLASAHVPLMDVRNVLTIGRVLDTIDLAHEACIGLGISRPRIAVCGFNPHAGESGELGDEETRIIEPAISLAQESDFDVRGPFPGDTVFQRALAGEFDLVVAMYHDQGLIPVKLLDWDRAVNVTLGLPTVRTSPDHGTAFDIAGQNKASESSMVEAIRLAIRMAITRAGRSDGRGARASA